MYKLISRLYPYALREKIKELLICSGMKIRADKFIGFSIIASIVLSLSLSFLIGSLSKLKVVHISLLAIVLFIVFQLFFYLNLMLKADSKAKFVESILPDALQLTASNLKAGLTVERALLLSARPEFGSFSEELTMTGREIATGRTIEESLLGVTKRIRSDKLTKTIMLIVQGVKSGGELATLLSQTAQNLRNQTLVEERMKASAQAYFIFILSAVAFASPVLFALSSFLAEVIKKQLSTIEVPPGLSIPISVNAIPISSNFILGFITVTLTTLCLFGALALGFIKKGSLKEGIRYIPILLGFSIGMFFLVRLIIGNIFSGLS